MNLQSDKQVIMEFNFNWNDGTINPTYGNNTNNPNSIYTVWGVSDNQVSNVDSVGSADSVTDAESQLDDNYETHVEEEQKKQHTPGSGKNKKYCKTYRGKKKNEKERLSEELENQKMNNIRLSKKLKAIKAEYDSMYSFYMKAIKDGQITASESVRATFTVLALKDQLEDVDMIHDDAINHHVQHLHTADSQILPDLGHDDNFEHVFDAWNLASN